MRATTYEVEAQVERDHWWFRGRRRLLARLIDKLEPALPAGARVLDVGCGTGANGPVLAEAGRTAYGIDMSPVPLGLAGTGERGHAARLRGDAGHLPFADKSFDMVVALDVLEHIADDAAAAGELLRVLRPGGVLIAFVPALQWLWGLQDDVSHHLRRYHRPQFGALLGAAGFSVERLTYFNTLLLPPIAAARFAMKVRPPAIASENQVGGPLANRILGQIFALETPWLSRFDLPIGVSLAAVARRRPA
jgi:SAM-dependent methyltransferase